MLQRSRRPSKQTVAVLCALSGKPAAWRYGYELCQDVGLKAGSMYPILMRLADRGLLETAWESVGEGGRPPRHLYRLSGAGRDLVAQLDSKPTRVRRPRLKLRAAGAGA